MIKYNCPSCGNKLQSVSIGWYCDKCKGYFDTKFVYLNYIIKEFSTERIKQKMSKESLHKAICVELNELYQKKNEDYGDSFYESYIEDGMTMVRIRIGDKWNRFKTLSKGGEHKAKDESIRDTLLDMANYAIMAVMEMDLEN